MALGFGRFERQGEAAAIRELSPLSALVAEAGPAGLMAQTEAGAPRARRLIAYAALLREIARRSGRVETLARAASAATRALREAGSDGALKAEALHQQAECQHQGLVLFGDGEAAETAHAMADQALALSPPALLSARLKALKAGVDAALALAASDRAGAEAAAEALEVSAKVLNALRAPMEQIAAVAIDRADLVIGLGALSHDRSLIAEAEHALSTLLAQIDADRLPVTWTRAKTLHGQALVALGEVAGDAASIAEGVAALKAARAVLPPHHAPLDQARTAHALGLALQAMGEACEEEALFDGAVKAFTPAMEALDRAPTLPYRAIVAHDAAVCLARRAERRGDLKALEQAELTFREALRSRSAAADPLQWAVTQVALARIYEAEASLRPDTGERADAAFALASALEVFSERGMRTLSAAALSALERVKERA
jgi:tetratricopeptide (TPR) repeat protein